MQLCIPCGNQTWQRESLHALVIPPVIKRCNGKSTFDGGFTHGKPQCLGDFPIAMFDYQTVNVICSRGILPNWFMYQSVPNGGAHRSFVERKLRMQSMDISTQDVWTLFMRPGCKISKIEWWCVTFPPHLR